MLLNISAALGLGQTLNQNQQNVAGAINNYFSSVGGTLPPGYATLFGLTGSVIGTMPFCSINMPASIGISGIQKLSFSNPVTLKEPFSLHSNPKC